MRPFDLFLAGFSALALLDWITTVIQVRAWQLDLENVALHARVVTGMATSTGATLAAIVALAGLTRHLLTRDEDIWILLVIFVLLSVPQLNWLQLYVRRRFH